MAIFEYSGIFSLNPETFTDFDFMPAYFSNKPLPAAPNFESINNPKKFFLKFYSNAWKYLRK